MYSTIVASNKPLKLSDLNYGECFEYYEVAHDGSIYSLLKKGLPIYTTIDTSCREGLLYETAIIIQQFRFLKYTHKYIGIEIGVDYIPSLQSNPYIDYLYLLLKEQTQFTHEYSNDTIFTCSNNHFSVPLYSYLLYFIKYNDVFRGLEPKSSVCQTDLYDLVDAILNNGYEEDIYVAFATWYFLETGSYKLFKCYDAAHGNSVTGIAHYTEDLIVKGSILSYFSKFLNKYKIFETKYTNWISYLLELHKTKPYDSFIKTKYRD